MGEAEFPAVAREQFFDQPRLMIEHAPALYRVLKEYSRQDASERVSRHARGKLKSRMNAKA
jgi:MtfA peptidase